MHDTDTVVWPPPAGSELGFAVAAQPLGGFGPPPPPTQLIVILPDPVAVKLVQLASLMVMDASTADVAWNASSAPASATPVATCWVSWERRRATAADYPR